MPRSIPRYAAAVVFALSAATAAQAASYHIVDLGANIDPTQVNKRGDVSGETTGYPPRAIVYHGERWKDLPGKEAARSGGRAINAAGDVAGYVDDFDNYTPHVALWVHGGDRMYLPMPSSRDDLGSITVTGLSDDQVVVGHFDLPFSNTSHCFRSSVAEGAVDLGLMARGRECHAWAINRQGVVVGGAPVTYKGESRAFRYENGEFRNLGTLPGDVTSTAYAINNRGHIVGMSGPYWFAGRAFLWSGGVMKDIGTSPDYAYTSASSINDHGDIVGYGQSVDGTYHAVRFADGQVISLETEVVDLADWTLWFAGSVNESGRIVGQGQRADGEHAFELIPIAGR